MDLNLNILLPQRIRARRRTERRSQNGKKGTWLNQVESNRVQEPVFRTGLVDFSKSLDLLSEVVIPIRSRFSPSLSTGSDQLDYWNSLAGL